jgi:hypothetical protein
MYINRQPVQGFLFGCAQILDGIIKVLSLGFVGTTMVMGLSCWLVMRKIDTLRKSVK